MLSATHLTEILPLPEQEVTPIPDMPSWVLGAYNWRGEVLWVVDLAMLLGMRSTSNRAWSHHKLLITHTPESRLGLAVWEVEDMLWCNPDQIESAPANTVTAALAPVLQGYTLGSAGEMLLVLDASAVQQRALQLSDGCEF
jgi:positive phototaxis protein PixI